MYQEVMRPIRSFSVAVIFSKAQSLSKTKSTPHEGLEVCQSVLCGPTYSKQIYDRATGVVMNHILKHGEQLVRHLTAGIYQLE